MRSILSLGFLCQLWLSPGNDAFNPIRRTAHAPAFVRPLSNTRNSVVKERRELASSKLALWPLSLITAPSLNNNKTQEEEDFAEEDFLWADVKPKILIHERYESVPFLR